MALLRVLWIVFKQIVLFFSGEYYLGYKKFDLKGVSWYNLLHPECIKEVQSKHRLSKYLATFLRLHHETSRDWIVFSQDLTIWQIPNGLPCIDFCAHEIPNRNINWNAADFFFYSGRPNFFSNKCLRLSEKENVWSRKKDISWKWIM